MRERQERERRGVRAVFVRAGVVSGVLLLMVSACRPSEEPALPETPQAPVAEPAEQEAVGPVHRCALSVAEERIDSLVLRSEDGRCQVMLPLDPAPGEYAVRVSAAGTTDQAAVEWRTADGEGLTLADRGTVVLEESGERIRGQLSAESSAGSEVRRAEARFDVAAPEEP